MPFKKLVISPKADGKIANSGSKMPTQQRITERFNEQFGQDKLADKSSFGMLGRKSLGLTDYRAVKGVLTEDAFKTKVKKIFHTSLVRSVL